MNNNVDLAGALADWARTQDAPERAAVNLLIDQAHWIRDPYFIDQCIAEDEGIYFIRWWRIRELLHDWAFSASSGELAILRFAATLANDALGLTSLDRLNRELAVDALAQALGVSQ
jgi:hypothetical protein